MLSTVTPPQAAPALRARGMRLRPHVGPNAFGNALGNSLAGQIGRSSQQEEVLGATFADDMGARKAANYWNPEPEAKNWNAQKQTILDQAINADGFTEEDYAYGPAKTTADQYADTFGGEAVDVAGRYRGRRNSVRPAFSDARFEYGDPRFVATRKLSDEQIWQQKKDMVMHGMEAAGDTLVRWRGELAQGAKEVASSLG